MGLDKTITLEQLNSAIRKVYYNNAPVTYDFALALNELRKEVGLDDN